MAALNTVDLSTETAAGSVDEKGVISTNTRLSSTNLLHRWGISVPDLPDIPDIPSPLMKPPKEQKIEAVTTGSVSLVGSTSIFSVPSDPLTRSSVLVGKHPVTEPSQRSADFGSDASRGHVSLDDLIRSQVGSHVEKVFASSLKDLQDHLAAKAHEVDKLRAEFQSMENKEKDILSSIPRQSGNHTMRTTYSSHTNQHPGVSSSLSGPTRSVGLGSRTVGLPIPATGSTGIEFVVSQSAAQIEDLKKKLKLTTELCAKQDAYYREVVSGLENQLKESVAGRDHILALREKEAASQLTLIHQLEAAVRKQQQITATKEEALISMESKMNQVENDVTAHKSISDKFKRILLDEEKKRFGSSLVTSALANSCAVGQIGDAMVEILQICLFDDDNEKKTLKSNLDRVEAELKSSRELTESRQEELEKEYKARISKLEEGHRHQLDSSSNRAAHARKELETLQDETDKLKQQHQTEVAAMEDKVKCLKLELNRTRSSGRETAVNLETKAKELECRVRELSAELQILREEKEKLLMQFSQEQANVIAINEKLSRAENLRQEEAKKLQVLVKELSSLQKKYTEEVKGLKSDITGKESLLKELREEAIIQRESEVEKALKEEKEKSNTRLDGILNELTKSNNTVSALTSNLEATKLELSKLQRDNGKINENLKLTAKEVYLVREEKVKLTLHLEEKEKELSNTQGEVAELTSSLERQTKNLLEAKNLIEKLQTQLSEREKIIETFREQGSNLAEIIEKNSQTGDSLQREREQLVRTLEERIGEVEEMKNHREILAKKLRAKDKKLKELEEEKATLENSVKIKQEELDALMEDRSNIMAELKLRQIEVTKLKDENTSLNSLMEGKDGEREKEITKLLSRLKGSEQDLALTRKLLKTKGDMSGKAVRVAESMQKEVTTKRGELDTLQNKIHWLKENLDTATKDARYYERKRSELAVTVDELTVERDQLDYELRKVQEQSEEYRKQLNHMEQALEKAALKHADSQGAIEKMEQEMARLKLKHSLEIKELERNSKTASFSIKPEAAAPLLDLLMKLNGGLRLPPLTSQVELGSVLMSRKNAVSHPLQTLLPPAKESHTAGAEQESEMKSGHLPQQVSDAFSKKNGDVTEDLKTLLHEVRSLICSFQAHSSQPVTPAGTQGIASSWDGPQAERGPLRGGPRLYGKSDVDTPDQNVLAGDTVHKETHCSDKAARAERSNRCRFPKEGLQQKADSLERFTRAFEGSKVSTVTTDLNSRVSSNYGLDECGEDVDDILPPLHSSSPKKDIADSSELTDEHSGTRSANHSPLSLSFHSDDSDVTALLIDDQSTSTAETVIPRDSKISSLQGRVRSGASSVSSSHDSLSRTSSVASDVAEVLGKHVQPAPQTDKVGREHGDLLFTDRSATDKRKHIMAKSSRKAGGKEVSNRKTSSDSEPVYRRAEMILQSLAQTGEHLTKKNKEIEHLLKEQHKRIKKCRKNEDNIHALLT